MAEPPIEVADPEKLVRAIKTPHHVREGRNQLRPAAFRPPAGTDEVSVMRHIILGTVGCRAKAKEIASAAYVGMATITAGQVRSCGSAVCDSRMIFIGHADIHHGIVAQPDEPQSSVANMLLTERCRALACAATYHPDPDPNNPRWTGSDL
jgi:hypothetical protein